MNRPTLKRFLIASVYLSQSDGHASVPSGWPATKHTAFIASEMGGMAIAGQDIEKGRMAGLLTELLAREVPPPILGNGARACAKLLLGLSGR